MKNDLMYSCPDFDTNSLIKTVYFWQSMVSIIGMVSIYITEQMSFTMFFLWPLCVVGMIFPYISLIWSIIYVVHHLIKRNFHVLMFIPLGFSFLSFLFSLERVMQIVMAAMLAVSMGI